MKRLKIFLILCVLGVNGLWAITYTVTTSTNDCVSQSNITAGNTTYRRGIMKATVTITNGSTARFAISMCTSSGGVPSGLTFSIKESTSSNLSSALQSSTVETYTTTVDFSPPMYMAHNLSFTTGSRSYVVTSYVAGYNICSEIITITASADDYGGDCTNYDYLINPTTSWQITSGGVSANGYTIYYIPTCTQGDKYTFKTGCGDGATANFDTYLYLYNSSCNEQTRNDDDSECSSNLSRINEWICPASGTYYLKITGYNGASGSYTLSYKRGNGNCSFSPTIQEPYYTAPAHLCSAG